MKDKNEIDYLSHIQDLKVFELKAPRMTLKDLRGKSNKGRIGCGEIKKRPILFSTPMVRAILDGKKTMTRRIYKPWFDSWGVGDKLWVREMYVLIHGRADYAATCDIKSYRWRPPISMPRKYSRLLLEITGIKRESLRDISKADAKREGFDNRQAFLNYFEEINPEMKGQNPEVVAIGFKILEVKNER